MKKIPQDRIAESVKRNCLTTTESGSFLYDLVELCDKVNDNRFYELIPIRLVAYLEDVLRVKYEFVFRQQATLNGFLKRNKLQVELHEQIDNGRLPLSIQLAYSFGCNNLDEICRNIQDVTCIDVNFIGREKLGNDSWGRVRKSISSLFVTRHRLSHESGFGVIVSKDLARTWIQDVGILLMIIDDVIIKTVYKDYHVFKESDDTSNKINDELDKSIKEAKNSFEEAEKALDNIIMLSTTGKKYPRNKPNLEYLTKWKEYRDLRVASDNVFPVGSKQNLLFSLKEKTQYTNSILKELRLQYRDFLNYITCMESIG